MFRSKRRWDYDIQTNLDICGSEYGPVRGCCEYGNEHQDRSVDQLRDCS
jgi:hypothetical protein